MNRNPAVKIRAALVLFIAVLVLAAFPASAGVRMNRKKASMLVGQTLTLKVKGTKKAPKWSSSNKKVASVDQTGRVTARKKGTAVIKAKVKKKVVKCTVRVQKNSWQLGGDIGAYGNWNTLAYCNRQTSAYQVKARPYGYYYDGSGNLHAKIAVLNMTYNRNYRLTGMFVRLSLDGTVIAEGSASWDSWYVSPQTYDTTDLAFVDGDTRKVVDLNKSGGRIYFSIMTN